MKPSQIAIVTFNLRLESTAKLLVWRFKETRVAKVSYRPMSPTIKSSKVELMLLEESCIISLYILLRWQHVGSVLVPIKMRWSDMLNSTCKEQSRFMEVTKQHPRYDFRRKQHRMKALASCLMNIGYVFSFGVRQVVFATEHLHSLLSITITTNMTFLTSFSESLFEYRHTII